MQPLWLNPIHATAHGQPEHTRCSFGTELKKSSCLHWLNVPFNQTLPLYCICSCICICLCLSVCLSVSFCLSLSLSISLYIYVYIYIYHLYTVSYIRYGTLGILECVTSMLGVANKYAFGTISRVLLILMINSVLTLQDLVMYIIGVEWVNYCVCRYFSTYQRTQFALPVVGILIRLTALMRLTALWSVQDNPDPWEIK